MMNDAFNIFYTDNDVDDLEVFKDAAQEISSSLLVTTQENGDELISLLQNPPPVPSVVLLDLNMPVKNGYDVLKEINQLDRGRNFPVVIFTTSDDEQAITATRELGADLFIPKPSSFTSLKKVITYLLSINWDRFASSDENFVYRIK
jgi:CheY-like chemotaxis protein